MITGIRCNHILHTLNKRMALSARIYSPAALAEHTSYVAEAGEVAAFLQDAPVAVPLPPAPRGDMLPGHWKNLVDTTCDNVQGPFGRSNLQGYAANAAEQTSENWGHTGTYKANLRRRCHREATFTDLQRTCGC